MTIPFPGGGARRRRQGLPPVDRRVLIAVALAVGFLAFAIREGTVQLRSIVLFSVLIPSIILHEVSHGAVALRFGDATAKEAGRLSLNPIRHIDLFGTIVLPAILVLGGGPAFGYAKPVPVNPRRMRNPRDHGLLTSLAGPGTNIVLALATVLVIRAVGIDIPFFGGLSLLEEFIINFGVANVYLAVFNLLPIPPLDGSAVIERFMPASWWPRWLRLRELSMLLLFGIVLLVPGFLRFFFDPALEWWARIAF